METKVGIVGLGKLGLPLAVVMAKKYDVVGIDLDHRTVDMINDGESPYDEPDLQDRLIRFPIKASTEYSDLADREIIFTILPTPSQENGKFSNKYLEQALQQIGKHCLECRLVSIVSTVMPGSCERFREMLPNNIDLCYNPTFIALGRVIRDLEEPDILLIGEDNPMTGELLENTWGEVIIDPGKIRRTTYMNAEISKIALNSFVTMKINFANNLGEVCENLGGDCDAITNIIGRDRRVGHAFLKSGMPFGGPCFPRDNRAYSTLFNRDVIHSEVDRENDGHIIRIVDRCNKILTYLKGRRINLVGLGYKPDTKYTFDSPSRWLADSLDRAGVTCFLYEDDVKVVPEADLTILCLPTNAEIKGKKVLDCWRCRPDLNNQDKEYYALGK